MMEWASAPQFTCDDCEVGWSSSTGNQCWVCGKVSIIREPVTIWFMKACNPSWRIHADSHRPHLGVQL